MQLVWGASTALATAGAEHSYCAMRFVTGQPKWQGDLPELAWARRRICPLQERSVELGWNAFPRYALAAYRYRPPCESTPVSFLKPMYGLLFFLRLSFYRLRLRVCSTGLLYGLETRAAMLKHTYGHVSAAPR
jgi:hypothetical protein